MTVETADYPTQLDPSEPLGIRPKSEGDNHLRLLKHVIKTTFPNVNDAVNFTPAQANLLASLAGVSLLGRAANSAGAPAAIVAGANDRILSRVGDALAFTQLTAGMFPSAVVPDAALSPNSAFLAGAQTFTGIKTFSVIPIFSAGINVSGGSVTLPATSIADAALSSNVPLKNAVNIFTTNQSVESAGGGIIGIGNTSQAANEKNWGWWVQGKILRHFAWNDAKNGTTNWLSVERSTGLGIASVTIVAPTIALQGNLSTPNTNASEAGYKGAPSRQISSSQSVVADDTGKMVWLVGGTGQTLTFGTAPPLQAVIAVYNGSGNNWTIAASGTLIWAATNGAGNRTLAAGGMVTLWQRDSGTWVIGGSGLS